MAMEDEDASWLMAVRGARQVVEGLDPGFGYAGRWTGRASYLCDHTHTTSKLNKTK